MAILPHLQLGYAPFSREPLGLGGDRLMWLKKKQTTDSEGIWRIKLLCMDFKIIAINMINDYKVENIRILENIKKNQI